MDCFRVIFFSWKHKMQTCDACLKTVSRASERMRYQSSIAVSKAEHLGQNVGAMRTGSKKSLVCEDRMKSLWKLLKNTANKAVEHK